MVAEEDPAAEAAPTAGAAPPFEDEPPAAEAGVRAARPDAGAVA